jgi:hypothetical protein
MHDHSQLTERLAYLFGGVALISLSQAAFVLTIIATLLTIVLAVFRLHDRLKYGPQRDR